MLSRTIKRFYKEAAASPAEGGFDIRLDGRPVKTPAMRPLAVPTVRLAEAVAAEWRDQGEEVRPAAMPLTQLASTALDRIAPERPAITAQLLGYAGTDLLCYRAEHPADLARRQTEGWQPLLDWAAQALDAPLIVTAGLLPVTQPATALAALERHLAALDPWRLTAVQAACAAMGSLVLALALAAGRLTAEQAFALAQLDEDYQNEKWGEDDEAIARRLALAADVASAERLLALLD